MKIITLRQILLLHEYMVKKHGGLSGVRDMNMLESAVHRPFATYGGKDLYNNVFLKAGALVQSIVKNHPFVDGNKRTAFSSAYIFLKQNGVAVEIKEKEVVGFMLAVANKNLSVDEISEWLRARAKRNP